MKRVAFALLILSGCCKPQVIPAPCPEPPAVQRPALRIYQLQPAATVSEVLQAYVLDLAEMVGHADKLEAYLDAYRAKVKK